MTVNDDDPNNPVVAFTAYGGAVRISADTDSGEYAGEYSAAFDVIDLDNNIVISGTTLSAEVAADHQIGNQIDCYLVDNPAFKGGFMTVGGSVFTRAGVFVG